MMNLMKIYKIELRNLHCFHTTSNHYANPGKFMRKILGGNSKKRRIFVEKGIMPTSNALTKGSYEGRYSGSARRVSVLNKLFMRHITDLMATGEYANEFLGYKIEINRVQVTPDYKGVNVFWVAKGTQNDEQVEKVLKKNAGFLRHELSALRVMGVVPLIQFVKDKQYSQIVELDERLAKADFGEDHEPVEIATQLKTQLELYTPLSPDLREKIQQLDSEYSENNEDDNEEPLPPMPQDVLGLNHYDILNRIKRNMKKSEALHRVGSCNELPHNINENPIEFLNDKEQRMAFKDFLEKRELLRYKSRKLEKNYIPDVEYIKKELEERHNNLFKNMDFYNEDDDYVTDEDDLEESNE